MSADKPEGLQERFIFPEDFRHQDGFMIPEMDTGIITQRFQPHNFFRREKINARRRDKTQPELLPGFCFVLHIAFLELTCMVMFFNLPVNRMDPPGKKPPGKERSQQDQEQDQPAQLFDMQELFTQTGFVPANMGVPARGFLFSGVTSL